MAWQGEKTLYSWGQCSSLTFDLDIQSISHSGGTVSGSGKLRLYYHNNCGGTGYYGYVITATPTGGTSVSFGTWSSKSDGYYQDRNVTFSFSAAASATSGELSVPWSSQSGNSGTVKWNLSFPSAATGPSGCSVAYKSCTYNSVTIESKVSSWGSGYSGTPNLEQIVVAGSATSSTWQNTGRQVKQNATSSTSSVQSVTNSNSAAYSGGMSIKGATPFKVAAWASTSVGTANAFSNDIHYTPPAPVKTITHSESKGSTEVTVNFTITGDTSSVNSSNPVTTHYRYSTDGGATWKPSSSTWYSISGTATAWTGKGGSFTCAYGASVKIKACQSYNGVYGGEANVSFTATNGDAPSAGTVTITGSTYNTVTLSASGVNYGKPDGKTGRSIVVGVTNSASSMTYKREKGLGAVTSGYATIDNNSSSSSAQPFTLKGMLPVYAYLWANNTVQSAFVDRETTAYYLPPAPGQFSYSITSETPTTKTYSVSFAGVAVNNVTDYTVADVSMVMEEWDDVLEDWLPVDNSTGVAITTPLSYTLSLGPQASTRLRGKLTYKNKDSEYVYLMLTNSSDPVKLYGGVSERDPQTGVISDPESKEVVHLYGSLNDETKKIIKLYGSHQGVSRLVFEDV